jgi:hypothetical protein
MKLTDLLYKVDDGTTVWVSDDPSKSEGIYFGPAGDIHLRVAAAYEVVTLYPERYPAIYNFAGITIIVKKKED